MPQIVACRTAAPRGRRGSSNSVHLRSINAFNGVVGQLRSSGYGRRLLARPRQHARIAAVLDVDEAEWDSTVLQSELPVLVDFWATWCGPCKLVAPSMVWAEKEYAGSLTVVKVDCTDANKPLMERYKVYGLPCLIVFRGGEEVAGSHREGAISRKDLVKYIEQHVGLSPTAAAS